MFSLAVSNMWTIPIFILQSIILRDIVIALLRYTVIYEQSLADIAMFTEHSYVVIMLLVYCWRALISLAFV